MCEVRVVPTSMAHVDLILPHVRAADALELSALGVSALEAMLVGIKLSSSTWTGFCDGEAVTMFGVVPISVVTGLGAPWLVSTDKLERYQFAFLRRCRPYLRTMMRAYPDLSNFVDARNTTAIRWLKWLGFEISTPIPYGYKGELFHRFYKENKPCAILHS